LTFCDQLAVLSNLTKTTKSPSRTCGQDNRCANLDLGMMVFLSVASFLSVSLLQLPGWCVTAKALPDISAISALTAVKHGNCSTYTDTHQKIIDMA
jgi:hypothetical protein